MPAENSGAGRLSIAELDNVISRASALIAMYDKQAHAPMKNPAELEHTRYEMQAIKNEILSSLMHAKGVLQKSLKG